MTTNTVVDFGKTAADYRQHRVGFPEQFFTELYRRELVRPGEKALDLGTGTGTVACGLAKIGCDVIATDISQPLLDQAKDIAQQLGLMHQITCQLAAAETLPFAEKTFDVVTAGQCWHWFDRCQAAQECWRVLKPGGKLLVAHFDWIPLPGNIAFATEALILKFNSNWALGGSTGLYPQWLKDVAEAGFHQLETFSFDVVVAYSHAAWRGRIRASAGVAASLPPLQVTAFDQAHQQMLADNFPADPLPILHRVWCLIANKPL